MDELEVSRVRSIPLAAVLEQLGAERDAGDPTRNWKLGGSRITVTGAMFFDHNAAGATHRLRDGRSGGVGAIDLMMYLADLPFRDAVRELGGWNADAVRQPAARQAHAETVRAARQASDAVVMPDPHKLPAVRRYLTSERAIPAELVERAIDSGKVFADRFANAVFRLTDETGREVGFELRGTTSRSTYHGARGEKGLFVMPTALEASERAAAFVESGIDNLSYQALRPGRLVFSTTGSAVQRPLAMAKHLIERGYTVYAAFDADRAGDQLAYRLSEHLGGAVRRDRPDERWGKDWNDVVRAMQRPLVRTGQVPLPER